MGDYQCAKAALEARPAPALELGRGRGEVLLPPDPADAGAYFMSRLISYKIVVSLCPMSPQSGGVEPQPPVQELLHAEWERDMEREKDLGLSQRVQMGIGRAQGGCSWPQDPWVVRGYCTAESLRHHNHVCGGAEP